MKESLKYYIKNEHKQIYVICVGKKYCVRKGGSKRAWKIFDNKSGAIVFALNKLINKDYNIISVHNNEGRVDFNIKKELINK